MTEPKLCKCGNPAQEEPHGCPFAEDVHHDYDKRCNCCKDCQQDCSDSI